MMIVGGSYARQSTKLLQIFYRLKSDGLTCLARELPLFGRFEAPPHFFAAEGKAMSM